MLFRSGLPSHRSAHVAQRRSLGVVRGGSELWVGSIPVLDADSDLGSSAASVGTRAPSAPGANRSLHEINREPGTGPAENKLLLSLPTSLFQAAAPLCSGEVAWVTAGSRACPHHPSGLWGRLGPKQCSPRLTPRARPPRAPSPWCHPAEPRPRHRPDAADSLTAVQVPPTPWTADVRDHHVQSSTHGLPHLH